MFIPLRETSLQTTRLAEFEVALTVAHSHAISIGSNGWQKSLARGFFTLLLHFPGHPFSIAIHGWPLLAFDICATYFCEDQHHPTFTAKSRKLMIYLHVLETVFLSNENTHESTRGLNIQGREISVSSAKSTKLVLSRDSPY